MVLGSSCDMLVILIAGGAVGKRRALSTAAILAGKCREAQAQMKRGWLGLVLLLLMAATTNAQTPASPIQNLVPEIIATHPHDSDAYTQGLLFYDGALYESTGSSGYPNSGYETTVRRVRIEDGAVLQQVAHGDDFFGEGLARLGDRLIQLSWTAGRATVYDRESLEITETIAYEGEGWGLCFDGRYLYMSDGSPYISLRDAEDFSLIIRSMVTYGGQPVQAGLLNELECVGDSLYANLWRTDFIAVLDKTDMQVTALIDASSLLTEEERAQLGVGEVLNGIAYRPETETFFITGKGWPKLFEVRFVPVEP